MLWYVVPHWFHTTPPTLEMINYIGAATVIVFLLIESYKWGEYWVKHSKSESPS